MPESSETQIPRGDDPVASWMRGLARETPAVTIDAQAMYTRTRVRALIEHRQRAATKLGRSALWLQLAGVVVASVCLSFAVPTLGVSLPPSGQVLLLQGHAYPLWLAMLLCAAAVLPWVAPRETSE